MNRVFFTGELEGVATFWRILRTDGVTLGFTSHNRSLWFDGIMHRAAPGMVPSALRRTADLSAETAEVQGVLSDAAINEADLRMGRFDSAAVQIGAVDWETRDAAILYWGKLGRITQDSGSFNAELHSTKQELESDWIPRTSPNCRAQFCGPGCNLSPALFTAETRADAIDFEDNAISVTIPNQDDFVGGELRWLDGPQCGLRMAILGSTEAGLILDIPIASEQAVGMRVQLREGCDHTFTACNTRFNNAVNFQGEPFVPGNDLLARYPLPE